MEKKHIKRRLNTPKSSKITISKIHPRSDQQSAFPVVVMHQPSQKIPNWWNLTTFHIEHLWKIPLKLQERILESQTIRECEHTWTLYEIIIRDIYPLIQMVVSKHASLSATLCLSFLPSRLCTVLRGSCPPLNITNNRWIPASSEAPYPVMLRKLPPLPKKGDTMQFLFLCTQKIPRFFFLGPSRNRILKGRGGDSPNLP